VVSEQIGLWGASHLLIVQVIGVTSLLRDPELVVTH